MTHAKSLSRSALAAAFLLLIPWVAMHFTKEIAWTLSDFVGAGGLLFGAGLTFELVVRSATSTVYRLAVSVAVAAGLFLIWGNLAVGFIGSENHPANLLYGGVLAVSIIGTSVVGGRAREMSRVQLATALTQFLVPVIAVLIWPRVVNTDIVQVVVLNTVFGALWAGAALLFRRASATGVRPELGLG